MESFVKKIMVKCSHIIKKPRIKRQMPRRFKYGMEPIIGKEAAEHWENCCIGYLPEDKNSKFSSLLWKIIVTRKYLAEWMTVGIIQKNGNTRNIYRPWNCVPKEYGNLSPINLYKILIYFLFWRYCFPFHIWGRWTRKWPRIGLFSYTLPEKLTRVFYKRLRHSICHTVYTDWLPLFTAPKLRLPFLQ